MRADQIAPPDAFVLEIPELGSVVSIDEELIAASLRSDRGRLAHLSLRARAIEAEAARLESELVDSGRRDDDAFAHHDELAALRARIDVVRARSDADVAEARTEASARVTRAIDEATELLAAASASLDQLVRVVDEEGASLSRTAVQSAPLENSPSVETAPPVEEPPPSEPRLAPESDIAPDIAPDVALLDVPVLLSATELESFLDRLEARVAVDVAEVGS